MDGWDTFEWEEWVPISVREQVMHFWNAGSSRSVQEWIENAKQNKAPKFGQRVRCQTYQHEWDEGRYVHAWNNVGRLVHPDGSFSYVGCQPFELLDPAEAIALVKAVTAEHEARGVRVYRQKEWFDRGEELFGGDQDEWKFRCPACGHVQSIQSIRDLQKELGLEVQPPERVFMWIIRGCAGRKIPGVGCNWSLSGLFQIHKAVIVTDAGGVQPVFEFAEGEQEE